MVNLFGEPRISGKCALTVMKVYTVVFTTTCGTRKYKCIQTFFMPYLLIFTHTHKHTHVHIHLYKQTHIHKRTHLSPIQTNTHTQTYTPTHTQTSHPKTPHGRCNVISAHSAPISCNTENPDYLLFLASPPLQTPPPLSCQYHSFVFSLLYVCSAARMQGVRVVEKIFYAASNLLAQAGACDIGKQIACAARPSRRKWYQRRGQQ